VQISQAAERFEVYLEGIELANGYHELSDPKIQLARFEEDCKAQKTIRLSRDSIDEYLLAALNYGFQNQRGCPGFDQEGC